MVIAPQMGLCEVFAGHELNAVSLARALQLQCHEEVRAMQAAGGGGGERTCVLCCLQQSRLHVDMPHFGHLYFRSSFPHISHITFIISSMVDDK